MAGAIGAWSWCLTDFDFPSVSPYAPHPFELTFGLLTTGGERKSTGEVVKQFADIIQQFGVMQQDRIGVVIPALQTGIVPFSHGPEGKIQTRVAANMLMTLAQWGFNPQVVREPIPSTDAIYQEISEIPALASCDVLFLVAPRIGEPMRQQLWDWVYRGGHLYVAYSYTFWLPNLQGQLGVTQVGPYNVVEAIRGDQHLKLDSTDAQSLGVSERHRCHLSRWRRTAARLSGAWAARLRHSFVTHLGRDPS